MAETLGDRMRMHRARLKLSQTALGKQVALSANSISAMEQGDIDPKLSKVKQIAKVLGVKVSYLIGEDSDNERKPALAS
jgi:putative transcriptional regulator